jgi:hypothetical protein
MQHFMTHVPSHIRTGIAGALLLVIGIAATASAVAQLPVRTRDAQLISNNNTNYVSLRAVDGQTSNWVLTLPATEGSTGSLLTTTVSGTTAAASWIAPGSSGQVLTITGGVPAWSTPAAGWLLTGNASTNPTLNFLGTTDAQPLVLRTNNTERMRILSTGEVGIGTSSPSTTLDISGTFNQTATLGSYNYRMHSGPDVLIGGINGISLESQSTIDTDRWAYLTLNDLGGNHNISLGVTDLTGGSSDGATASYEFDGTKYSYTTTIENGSDQSRIFSDGSSLVLKVDVAPSFTSAITMSSPDIRIHSTDGTDLNAIYVRPTEVEITAYPNWRDDTPITGPGNFLYTDNTGILLSSPLSYITGQSWLLGGNGGTNPATNFIGTTDAQSLVVRTSNTERLRINATGEVGIGTTAAAGYRLHVAGTAGTANVRLGSVSGAAITSSYTPTANDGLIVADANGDLVKRSASSVLNSTAWLVGGNTLGAAGSMGTNDAFALNIRTNATSRITVGATGDIALLGTAGTPNVTITSTSGTANATLPVGYDRALISNASGQVSQASFSAILASGAWTLTGNTGTNPATNFIGTTDAQSLVIRTSNTERLRINATGEVGIGTTAATGYSLHVAGTAGTANVRLGSVSGAAITSSYTPTANDGLIVADANGDLVKRSASSVLNSTAWLVGGNTLGAAGSIGTNDAFALNIRTNATSRITVGATGDIALLGTAGTPNVTITSTGGTANATVPVGYDRALVANSSGQVSQASFSAILASGAWTLTGNTGTNPATNFIGTTDAQSLVVRTNNAERMRINATGEVGIGTTPATGFSLHVGGTAGTPNVRLASVGGAAIATAWTPTANDGVITADNNGDLSKRTASSIVNAGLSPLSGTVNLTAGTTSVVVSNTNVTASSRIVVTYEDPNAAGFVATMVTTRVVGTSFTVAFSGPIPAAATGRLHYIIVNP